MRGICIEKRHIQKTDRFFIPFCILRFVRSFESKSNAYKKFHGNSMANIDKQCKYLCSIRLICRGNALFRRFSKIANNNPNNRADRHLFYALQLFFRLSSIGFIQHISANQFSAICLPAAHTNLERINIERERNKYECSEK